MAEPFRVMRGKAIGIGMSLLVLGTVIAVLGFLLVAYLGYRARQARVDAGAVPEAHIAPLTAERQLLAGDDLPIQVLATGPSPIDAVELWINGSLVGEDVGPDGGIIPLTSTFLWVPPSPGAYSLLARAVDVMDRVGVSDPLVVSVGQDPSDDLSGEPGPGVVFPGPSPESLLPGPSPEEITGPAEPWWGSPGNWLNSLVVDESPSAPALAAERDGCSAELRIRDLAESEEGFRIYRDSGGGWSEIAALAANSAVGWMTYGDPGLAGTVMYFVSAFNSQGESPSNLVGIHFPIECRPPSLDLAGQVLRLAQLQATGDVAGAYCYLSFDGLSWNRLPDMGFFGQGGPAPASAGEMPGYVIGGLEGGSQVSTMDLWVECWGWAGEALVFLGDTFIPGIELGQVEMIPFEGEGFSGEFALDKLSDMGFAPTSAQLPYLDDWVAYRRDECEQHIAPAGAWRCDPHATFNEGPTGPNPQPYILWDYREEVCPAGQYEDCLPISWWMNYAQDQGMRLRVEVQEWFEEVELLCFFSCPEEPAIGLNIPFTYYFDPAVPMYRVVPWSCAGDRHYRERLVVVPPGWDPEVTPSLAGPWSNGVYGVSCHAPLGDRVWLEATFYSVTFSNIEDCDPVCNEDIDVYGVFSVDGAGNLLLGWKEGYQTGHGATFWTHAWTNGSHLLEPVPLCLEDISAPGLECTPAPGPEFPPGWETGNNRMVFPVMDGQVVQLMVSLKDEDGGSANDTVCWAKLWTPPRSTEEWASIGTEDIVLAQSFEENGNADCSVAVSLRALPGPP